MMKNPDFFAGWYRFMKIKIWKISEWVWSKIGVATLVSWLLKLAVSQVGLNGINWFLVWWYKSKKAKSYFNNFCVVVVKTVCGLLGLETVKSDVSQEWIDEMS